MGILNRLHKAVNGIGGAVNAVVGIPLDIVRAPFREDEYDGIIGTLYGTVVNRGGQFFEETIGPEGAVGTLIGGQAEGIRKPARSVLNPILDAAEFAYREGISEPITTLTTVGSIGRAENTQFAFMDPKAWSRAYRIAQSRSPGQALALGIGKIDITDEAELASYIGSDAYKHWSGTFDALTRFFADPTVIAGKGAAALRTKAVVQPLNSAQDIERALRSPRVAKFNSEISRIKSESGSNAAAVIRDRFFPDHDAGSQISTILASAKSPNEQWLGLRALLGDKTAVTQLSDIRSKLAPEIASLNKRAEELAPTRAASYNYRGTTRDPETSLSLFDDERLRIQAQLDSYYASDLRYARLESAFAAITETPRARLIPNIPAIGEVRTSITRSDFYQSSPLARPLHAVFDMTPQRLVNLSDQSGDIQIDRLLNRAQVDLPIRDDIRSRYMQATDPSTRNQIAFEAEQTAVTHIAKRAGMSADELETVMNTIASQRGQALNLISKRVYDEKGRSVLHFEDDAGAWVNRHLPAWVTQDQTLFPLVDIDKVAHAATRIGQFKSRHPTTQIPTELLEGFHRLWRPSVLLRVGWPIRVVGDEQFRILAKIGALAQLNNLQSGLRNYTTDYIASVKSNGFKATRGSSNKEIRAQFGIRPLEINGYQMEGAFGASPDMVRHTKELVSASDTFRAITGNSESLMLRQLREAGEKFKSILPDNADYAPAYDWAVQRISTNPIAKRVLSGEDTDTIVNWLHSTPEGTDLLRANAVRSHNARNWVEEVKGQVDHYTAGNQELADIIAGRDPRTRVPLPPPTATNLPPLYHGTPKPISRPMQYGGRASENLFGPGFYTTDNPAVAQQYFRKGKRPGDAPIMYSVSHGGTPKILDMTKPIPEDLRGPVREYMENTIAAREYTVDDFNELRRLLDENASGEQLYAQYKKTLASLDPPITRGDADDYLTDLNDFFLEKGIEVFRYSGGVRTGNAKHNAYVFLNPEKISISDAPKAPAIEGPYPTGTPYEHLSRLIPDPAAQPIAHGEVLMQTFGEGYISKTISNITESLFEKLGRTPTNVLSRNRFFDHTYRAEAARLVNLLDDGNLTQAQLKRIEGRARSYALGETRQLLYDLAEQSELGRMLRFVSPFYNAWQEVLTRWTGLAIENPAFIARARLIWQSPEDAGIVTEIDGDEYLTVPLPEWAQSIPGLRTKNEVIFNKKSFNMVLQGPPGAGPAVQIPVNEIIQHRPDLESSVKFILPFGATDDTIGMILPATAKRAFSLAGGEEDRAFRNAMMRIYFDKITDIQLGKRDFDISSYEARQQLYEEAKNEAQSFFRIRMFASFTLPAAPTFRSPYQPQIDAFRQAQQRYAEDKNSLADDSGNPRTPDEWFLDTHGKEYFALTQAVTKSMDGIPPTLEAYEDRKKYADMVEKYPELGGLIVGYDGAGEFNSAVYQAQLSTALRPGSDSTQRRPLSFEEAAADPDRRMGWIEYRRAMDLIEAARIQRGLPSLQVKAAKDLADMKRAFTDHLKNKYPSWADDFNQTDKGKWDKKIAALREISADPRLAQRPDIQGIRLYLQAREVLASVLQQRGKQKNGAKTLNAESNRDLQEGWNTLTGFLVESNLPFSDVFYRHLENDPVGL